MTLEELRKTHREAILRIAAEYGVTDIRVFGSVARGQATQGSDIDLLVRLSRPLGLDFFEFEDRLEKTLGVEMDVVTEGGLHHLLKDRILADAVPL